MQKENKAIEQKQIVRNEFIKLSDLTAKDVKDWVRIPVKLNRDVSSYGINARMQLIIDQINLIINIVSSETVNGNTRPLRFYKPERMVALLFDLDLEQVDQRGRDVTEWTYYAPIRFVKGKTNSGDEYHQIEILFKQFKYESIFLNNDQLSILNSLDKMGKLFDFKGNRYKLDFVDRPESIDDIGEDLFEF